MLVKTAEWDGLLDLHVVIKFMAAMETQLQTRELVFDRCAAGIGVQESERLHLRFGDHKCKRLNSHQAQVQEEAVRQLRSQTKDFVELRSAEICQPGRGS